LENQIREVERKLASRLTLLEKKLAVLDSLGKDVTALKQYCNTVHKKLRGMSRSDEAPSFIKKQNGSNTTEK
jgi:hypothetical protein